jgi:hypothetical protein
MTAQKSTMKNKVRFIGFCLCDSKEKSRKQLPQTLTKDNKNYCGKHFFGALNENIYEDEF